MFFRMGAVLSSHDTLEATILKERLLLQTHEVDLPARLARDQEIPGIEHPASVAILRKAHSCQLDENCPLEIKPDGNSLYRAICRGLYGSEDSHLLLRLLTALEMGTNPSYYDVNQQDCLSMIGDQDSAAHDDYPEQMRRVCGAGLYSTMLHICGASAALSVAIASYCPLTSSRCWFLSDSLN